MDQHTTTVSPEAMSFEACAEYRSPYLDAECERCGWLEGEHADHDDEGRMAPVIPVPRRIPSALRRAS